MGYERPCSTPHAHSTSEQDPYLMKKPFFSTNDPNELKEEKEERRKGLQVTNQLFSNDWHDWNRPDRITNVYLTNQSYRLSM